MTFPGLLHRLALPAPALSPAERDRLNAWRRQYRAEQQVMALGFSTEEARRLLFARWRYRVGRLSV